MLTVDFIKCNGNLFGNFREHLIFKDAFYTCWEAYKNKAFNLDTLNVRD